MVGSRHTFHTLRGSGPFLKIQRLKAIYHMFRCRPWTMGGWLARSPNRGFWWWKPAVSSIAEANDQQKFRGLNPSAIYKVPNFWHVLDVFGLNFLTAAMYPELKKPIRWVGDFWSSFRYGWSQNQSCSSHSELKTLDDFFWVVIYPSMTYYTPKI